MWRHVGDLAAHAEALLIGVIANGNALVAELLEREVVRLKAKLMEDEPTPLARQAVQRIVACWLHTQYVDRATLTADAAHTAAASWAKRQEWAERRLQLAIKSLDLVRRLRPRKTAHGNTKVNKAQRPLRDEQVQHAVVELGQHENNPSQLNSVGHREKLSTEKSKDNAVPVNRISGAIFKQKVPVAS